MLANLTLQTKPLVPKPDRAKAESRRNEALEHEFSRLQRKLERAEQIIEAQKNCANG